MMWGARWGALLALLAGARALLPLEAEHLRASVGGYAVMNCHLDFPFGNEIPYHLQWEKDGEVIFSWYSGDAEPLVADRWGGRVRRVGGTGGLGRGSVNVSAVRETDAGLYRCRVAFPNRSPPSRNNGTFYYLDVDGGNLIVTPPTNATVLEGERAELECLPKSAEWAVQWYKEGAPLESLPELATRTERVRNGSLLLRAAASADLGHYECRVAADDGQQQSASAYLDVQYKAKVIYSPKERYLPYGKSASLDCHFSANPPLTNLRWEKDGFLFDPYNVPGVFYSRNGSLLFNRVDESHEGLYSCTPYNDLGSAGSSGGVRVRVTRPPALAARPPPLLLARLGAAVALPCSPARDPLRPPPSVRWTKKDGSPLPEGRYALDGGNLTISDVAEEDRGVYVCTVSNEADTVATETELLIENVPPRAPHDLTAVPSHDSIHVSWIPAVPNINLVLSENRLLVLELLAAHWRASVSPLNSGLKHTPPRCSNTGWWRGHSGLEVEYTVWYRGQAESEWRTMKILSRGVTHATLVGLRAGTRYELRVLSQDHIGDGLFSKPLFVRTLDPELGESEGATAFAAATTEEVGTGDPGDGDDPGELDVSVRLLEEGALVRWRGAGGGAEAGEGTRCSVRWYRDSVPAPQLLTSTHTYHDYILVSELEEGESYWARVQCGWGAGTVVVHVPQYARLRGVAIGAAVGALLLAALAAALLLARRRLRPRLSPDKRTR